MPDTSDIFFFGGGGGYTVDAWSKSTQQEKMSVSPHGPTLIRQTMFFVFLL